MNRIDQAAQVKQECQQELNLEFKKELLVPIFHHNIIPPHPTSHTTRHLLGNQNLCWLGGLGGNGHEEMISEGDVDLKDLQESFVTCISMILNQLGVDSLVLIDNMDKG